MDSDGTIVLSALLLGISSAGVVTGLRLSHPQSGRQWMVGVFALMGAMASIPLSATYARPLYLFHMPALLPCLMALPVVVYGFVKARTDLIASSRLNAWHLIVPFMGAFVTLGFWTLPTDAKIVVFVDGRLPPGWWPGTLTLTAFILLTLWCALSLAYLTAASRTLRRHRMRLKSLYSNMDKRELRWIDGLIALLIVLWIAAAAALLGDNFGSDPVISGKTVMILTAVYLLMFMGYAMSSDIVLLSDNPLLEPPSETEATKYSRSALSEGQAQRIASRIVRVMKEDQLYLDPTLSLTKLAASVRAPQHLVSQTLNEHLDTTFFDYVAHWRIEHARPLVRSGALSIHDIALQVGFNTRSTFYKAFRRETGLTPSDFRRAKSP